MSAVELQQRSHATPPSTVMLGGAGAFFGAMYFLQGIGDPVSGLVAQPVRALLKSWGDSPAAIAGAMALVALPWSLKPLFALICDFVPLRGTHRRHYLLLTSASASAGLLALYSLPLPPGQHLLLLGWLLLPSVAIAWGVYWSMR